MSTTSSSFTRDWAYPRTACAFTGYVKNESQPNPAGTLLLCVANTPIPCKADSSMKGFQLTVINVREKGWLFAPWKKPAGKTTVRQPRDENSKDLFVIKDWARNDVTMERVGQSVQVYSFHKDGQQSKAERIEDAVSVVASGQTFNIRLQSFMFEDKKNQPNVFPADMDVIPAFTVVEVMISSSHGKQFEDGWAIGISRVRPCEFSLFSMQTPLGLGLLASTYEESVRQAEAHRQLNPGLRQTLEDRNTGFYGKIVKGSYLIPYNGNYRLVGPKEDSKDQQSRHLNVMDGGVFAIDITKEDIIRFSNSGEEEAEDALVYGQFVLDFASAAGALDCYVTYNEYLVRNDPNRSPFAGVPLIDSNRLLEFIPSDPLPGQRLPLPFDFLPLEQPYVTLTPIPEDQAVLDTGVAPRRPFSDCVLTSENGAFGLASYILSVGDATEEDIMRLLFVPKRVAGGSQFGRQDYRLLKKRKAVESTE